MFFLRRELADLTCEVTCLPHGDAIARIRSFGELDPRIAAVKREVTKKQVVIPEVSYLISRRSAANAPVLVLLILV